jgi:hypothetical protein
VAATPVAAQQNCAPREGIVQTLIKQYGEHPAGRGLVRGGPLMEVFSSENGETWSALIHLPNGMSCIIAVGKDWQVLDWPVSEMAL